jgi:hypothetical protein
LGARAASSVRTDNHGRCMRNAKLAGVNYDVFQQSRQAPPRRRIPVQPISNPNSPPGTCVSSPSGIAPVAECDQYVTVTVIVSA